MLALCLRWHCGCVIPSRETMNGIDDEMMCALSQRTFLSLYVVSFCMVDGAALPR